VSSGRTRRISGTFRARGDDGLECTVLIVTEYLREGTYDDPHGVVEGPKVLRTMEGAEVERLRKGEYRLVDTGAILRSDAPDAF
jgi:hypothetical protein